MTTTNRRTVRLIANPRAGRGGCARAREVTRFCELLKHRGVEVEVKYTRAAHDATRLASEAAREGRREVIASGGDGTINEVLQGLIGTDVRLGIWPAGTANVLARELSLPFDLEGIAEVIARGETRRIYIGCAIDETTNKRRYFFLMAGIGLDASIVERVRPRLKRRIGKGAFWASGLGHLAHWQPVPFIIEAEGETYDATFAAIGKTAHYGGDLSITPRARLENPEFEICVINSHRRLRYLYLLSQAMRARGFTGHARDIRFIRTTRARATGGDACVQVDGELIGRLPMSFEIASEPMEVMSTTTAEQKAGVRV